MPHFMQHFIAKLSVLGFLIFKGLKIQFRCSKEWYHWTVVLSTYLSSNCWHFNINEQDEFHTHEEDFIFEPWFTLFDNALWAHECQSRKG